MNGEQFMIAGQVRYSYLGSFDQYVSLSCSRSRQTSEMVRSQKNILKGVRMKCKPTKRARTSQYESRVSRSSNSRSQVFLLRRDCSPSEAPDEWGKKFP